MLGGITIETANPWLGYKRSEAMIYVMPGLYKSVFFFIIDFKYLKREQYFLKTKRNFQ